MSIFWYLNSNIEQNYFVPKSSIFLTLGLWDQWICCHLHAKNKKPCSKAFKWSHMYVYKFQVMKAFYAFWLAWSKNVNKCADWSKRKSPLVAQDYNQFQKSWDRCHKTFEFQQTTIPPRPLFNVVSHFSSGLMCFGLNNIDWGGGRGRGAVLCVNNCNDPLTS
jgi:hypothetical protein